MQALQPEARIETDRLVLRPPALADAGRVAELVNDIDIARMTTSVPHPYYASDAEGFLAAYAAGDLGRDRLLLVEHRAFGVIGMMGFHYQDAP